MNWDDVDWAGAWATVLPAIEQADSNATFSAGFFLLFGLMVAVATAGNVVVLHRRGRSVIPALLVGTVSFGIAGLFLRQSSSQGHSEARAVHARIGTCEDIGHGMRRMSLDVIEVVDFDLESRRPTDERPAAWNVDRSLCDLPVGSEQVLLCATGGECVAAL